MATCLTLGAAPLYADIVEDARANIEKWAGPQTTWEGPESAPKPEPGKKIAYLSNDENNDASRAWGEAIKAAGEKIGWEVTIIDGQASPIGWARGFNQAVALGVDGIIMSTDAASLAEPIGNAKAAGIPVVGIHSGPFPGPSEELGLFTNIQQDPREIGQAQADWIIADSDGKARVVVTSHNEFAIAEAKSRATEERLKACEGCEVLDYVNSPIAEVAQRQPQLVTSWVQKYGTPLYVTAVADYTLDFQVPALRSAAVPEGDVKLVGADGQDSAYARIRRGEYQVVTVSEPVDMQGYQAIDEINRALHGQPPSGFVQAPYVVTIDNVDAEGGDTNAFVPSNDYAAKYLELWGVVE
ncbi:substrate-binding domain-containing protein [uncultured Marivita sp.]|uniref:substrate-binding domain-containing protein n=1 Tax=uncultured Marivita sp. TaxID=888080 RepID=UPI00261F6812|nr:substrate-binding domain-containing protein [uncultured Marivita sp.]